MLPSADCAKTIAAVALAVAFFASSAAEARRGVKPYYSETLSDSTAPRAAMKGFLPQLILLLQTLP